MCLIFFKFSDQINFPISESITRILTSYLQGTGGGRIANCSGMKPESAAEERNLNSAFNNNLSRMLKNSIVFYRVTHQVVQNLLLTSNQKFRFGLAWTDLARPKRNFGFEVNGRFCTT